MNETKKAITIIPNEEVLNIPPYYEETTDIHFPHFEMCNNFSRKYNLGYHFKSFEEPYVLVDLGHILITSVDDFVICDCPSTITEKQYALLLEKREFLSQFKHFTAGRHIEGHCESIGEMPVGYEKSKIDYFYDIMEQHINNRGRK